MLVNNRLQHNASAVVFHRGLYEKVTTDLTRFRLCGDWVCWAQMIAASGQVAWIHRKLNSFRQHTDKVTSQAKKNGMEISWSEQKQPPLLSALHSRHGGSATA